MNTLLKKIEDNIKCINYWYCEYPEHTSTLNMKRDLKSTGHAMIQELEDEMENIVFEYTINKFNDAETNNIRGAWLNSFISWVEREVTGEKVYLAISCLHSIHIKYRKL